MAATINTDAYSDALVLLGTAAVAVPLLRRLGVTPVLAYLCAGVALGPLGLGALVDRLPPLYWVTVTQAKSVASFAELGVVFLLFVIGLELSYERLLTMRRLVFGLGGLQVAVTTALLAGLLALFGTKPAIAVVIGACLALSSTAIVLEVLAAEGRLSSSSGRATFAVLLAQDIAVVPILVLVSIIGAGSGGSVLASLAAALAQAAVALAVIVAAGRLLLRPLFRLVVASRTAELFIAATLFIVVATGVVAAQAGLSMALGAFVAGVLLSESEYRKAVEATVKPFKGLLLGLFFFTVGMGIDLREVVRDPATILAAVAGLVLLKSAVMLALARGFGLTLPAALESALVLGPGGEFAFVGIGAAAAAGFVPPATAGFALVVTSLSMALIPLLAMSGRWVTQRLAEPKAPDAALADKPGPQKSHAIVVGHGRVGQVVRSLLAEHRVPHISVDHDAASVTRSCRRGEKVYYGDAASPAFLETCGVREAAGVVITIHTQQAIDEIVRQVRRLNPDIPVVVRARDGLHARQLYAVGATDAVPETIETSLQLSEAALVGLGVPTGPVIASIHAKRDAFRNELRQAADASTGVGSRSIRAKSAVPAAKT